MHIRCYEAVVAQWHSVGHNCDDCGFDLIDSVYRVKNIFLCNFAAEKGGRRKSISNISITLCYRLLRSSG